MNLTIINDTHLGVNRQTGTTPQTQKDLSKHIDLRFWNLVYLADGSDLLINGDLFDSSEVGKIIEFQTYVVLKTWCQRNSNNKLFLAAGNHDLSKSSDKISSFNNLTAYLEDTVENMIIIKDEHREIYPNVFVIPHVMNQELFDSELKAVLLKQPKYVFLHANFDNKFAAQTDHSLNVSAAMAQRFAAVGCELIFAHEHNKREVGNVHIIGNQIITSVADCLDTDAKQYLKLDNQGLHYQVYEQVADRFAEVDWTSADVPDKDFIRIIGQADYEAASDVIARVRKIRQESNAFVVSNAVEIKAITGGAVADMQDIRNYDIAKLVDERLPEPLKVRFQEVVSKTTGDAT